MSSPLEPNLKPTRKRKHSDDDKPRKTKKPKHDAEPAEPKPPKLSEGDKPKKTKKPKHDTEPAEPKPPKLSEGDKLKKTKIPKNIDDKPSEPPKPSTPPKPSEDDKSKKTKKNVDDEPSKPPKPPKAPKRVAKPKEKLWKRKNRCKQCENCLRPNCGTCLHCLDMKRFGGPQLLKQCCMNRKCLYQDFGPDEQPAKFQPPALELTPALEELSQSKKSFLQNEPCWKLSLKANQCRQCANDLKYGPSDAIMCRFYLFRKLEFKDDRVLTPAGFESCTATNDDIKLLIPSRHAPAQLDINSCKFILSHVGDRFCGVVEQEKRTRERFPTKDVVLKRTIQGVREMCDVCDTTIFNFHLSCATCGFVVCVDCYDGDEALWMACKGCTRHVKSQLMLTQTIPGDILWKMSKLTHDVCKKNDISMHCACGNANKRVNVGDTSKDVCQLKERINRLPQRTVDDKALDELSAIINCVVDGVFECAMFDSYPGPLAGGKEFCTRIFTMAESRVMFPRIAHSWLCEGRLLWLQEPKSSEHVPLFQEMWKRGQPILISNVHKHLDEDLWSPRAFSRDFGELENDLIDCLSGSVLHERMKNFWCGFEEPEKRLKDADGRNRLLKLKDWPPGDDFSEVLPTRFQDLMKALPLPDYTHRDGKLNLTARLPSYLVPPDLGPKMYIAYGSTQHPSQGTTNLHLDMSDAVNVMVYAGILKDGNEKRHVDEAFRAVCEAGCDILTRKRVRQEGVQVGAIWHIFRANDAEKIRKFLNDWAFEKGEFAEEKADPIHDQRWYLDTQMRHRLYLEYGVDGYAIAQCVGDAVFIPAGAPHQVRNLHSCIKVAEDFVTPENIGQCLMLTQEFRRLSNHHTNHEDKLQVKNICYHAVKDALSVVMAEEMVDSEQEEK